MPILLGFEIPTGRRVEIPDEGHAAFFGQTQLSGKTTLIEGITYRAPANVKAIAFITKRGEGSFLTARTIPPYFSEPTNDPEQPLWRWVSAILEASQQRKLRFEEAWIIRACEEPKRAKSLADVHQNIKILLDGEGEHYQKTKKKRAFRWVRKPVTGINQGVYTSLKAYFDIVMPQLERMPYTKTLDLRPGLNVMDLREYSMEAQGMVIRSVMEYVYRYLRNTRVIVPEAQDFVPQGKNSPVKMACSTMVRKGAADKNFMWFDSQDMAAVDKEMLRAVSILGCGVQGEAHEMGRAIAHLFGVTTKLTPRDIGSLKIGQFFLRLAGGEVTKVYVQPAWMDSEVHARAIAMGQESVSSARQILKKFKDEMATEPRRHEDGNEQEQSRSGIDFDSVIHRSNTDSGNDRSEQSCRSETIPEVRIGDSSSTDKREGSGSKDGVYIKSNRRAEVPTPIDQSVRTGEDETMWKEKYETLECELAEVRHLAALVIDYFGEAPIDPKMDGDIRLREFAKKIQSSSSKGQGPSLENAGATRPLAGDNGAGNGAMTPNPAPGFSSFETMYDTIYEVIKSRAAKDPGILQLLASHPELRVNIQRTVIELDDSTLAGKCARLISKGFFKSPVTGSATVKELKRLGCDQPSTNVYRALDKLTEQGFLTAEPDGYQMVDGMKVNIVEGK